MLRTFGFSTRQQPDPATGSITQQAYLNRGRRIDIFKATNLLSTTAVFVLDRLTG